MGFRRARLAATGNISEPASYMMEFDFAQAQARFVDVWGQVADTPLGKMRIGRFRQPFGMSDLTSIRELPFLERPTLFALGPFRQTGIMFFDTAQDKRRTYAISGFRSLSDNFGNVYGESGGYGLATRFTYLPIDEGDGRIVHLGFDYSFVDPARNMIQYASTDEVFIGQNPNLGPTSLSVLPIEFTPAFVNTGVFTVDNVNLFNVEGAIGWGRTVLQSEFRLAHVSTPVGTADLPGAYIHVRHMLTGESIPYNYDNGVFGRVKPLNCLDRCCGKYGAWELAARVSYLDLNSVLDLPGVTGVGRRLTSGTLGLNWYWWNNAKAQFNWIVGDVSDRTLGSSTANTFAARLQFDF
jgi:phosphate-selective porin OprO/OprP